MRILLTSFSGSLVIYCITGMPGSGKSVVSDTARLMGLTVLNMGDVIRDEARARGIQITPESLGALMLDLRREHGNSVVAKKCLERAPKNGSPIVIEGIRSLDELNYLRSNEDIFLIAVHASPKTRFERLLKRGRADDPKDWKSFEERDMRELGVGLGSVIALADLVLINEGPIPDLVDSAKRIFSGEFRWRG
ncbi:MAG: Dephospho-CoA kinase archaeal, predicted [Candidatus Methanosuratincola subterraneus]|uniref:Dephospho-CoA kinase archaeal, predicted n=1 Tax=Methanosuratincola subterraneus TaxID=2593994 RepID=A0A444L8Y2_METS7|nr:MAG: Dephospho-CoA kinase archaeal, predicted [Candidatus Methanosuratincola subterraneus]